MGLVVRLVNAIAMCVLLLGSCVGPLYLYSESPRWLVHEVGDTKSTSFFVAYTAAGADGGEHLHVAPARNVERAAARYRIAEGEHRHEFPGGGLARIKASTEQPGRLRVEVFVVADTPWTSLSEYRVVDDKVAPPFRHAQSTPWLLLGIPLCLALASPLMKLVRRATAKLGRKERA